MKRLFGLLVVLSLCLPNSAAAEEARLDFGGDAYVAGQAARIETAVLRDAFAAGYDVSVKASVTGDAHLAGYNVGADGAIAGNLYAAGSSISVNAPVGGDITAFGQSITLRAPATVAGNLRLAGASVRLEAPVSGSALVTAQTLTLDTAITGDLNFFGDSIQFGPAARVSGRVIIQAPSAIAVPETVANADRVSYTQLVAPDFATEAGRTAEHVVRGFWPAVWATGLWWLLLALVGLLFITLANRFVLDMEAVAARRPLRTIGLGILAFAAALGLVPVVALTVVGLVVLPFVLAFVAVAWAMAYVAGAYLLGLRIAGALLPIDSNLRRVGVLVAAIVVAGLVGMIPFIGWLLMLALTVFGFGTFAQRTVARWSAADASALQPPAAA